MYSFTGYAFILVYVHYFVYPLHLLCINISDKKSSGCLHFAGELYSTSENECRSKALPVLCLYLVLTEE